VLSALARQDGRQSHEPDDERTRDARLFDLAVALLTGSAPVGAYDLSGPRALSFGEAAAVLSQHAGREVRHVDLPVEAWKAGAAENGLPAEYAEMLGMLFTLIRDGHDAQVSDGVQRALGRPATSFEDWAAREAGALRG